MFTTICLRISRCGKFFQMSYLKTRQVKILKMNILKRGKKQDISNWYLARQEGYKNIKMHKIENIEIILLCSAFDYCLSIFLYFHIFFQLLCHELKCLYMFVLKIVFYYIMYSRLERTERR